ncbi:MAG TPA: cache domain-containing protein, partial [Trueperaceae bacterium]
YGGLGALVLLQPYLERCLGRIDPNSLRTRLALALAAAAAVPLVLAMALVTGQQANLAMRQALAAQETLANALAEGVADYIALHQAAVAALAAEPDLLDLPSARQTLILKAAKASYPDAYEYATIDADGAIVARTGVGPAEDIAMQDVFRAAQRGDASTVEILLSANAGQPLFGFGAPVYDGMGRFDGMVAGTLASARLSDLLRDVSGGDALAFLVDGGGRLIAQPERPPTDEPRDLSELPPVAVFLAHGGGRGSLQYQLPEGAMLAAYATVPRLGWGVVVERPRAVALAPVRSGRELVFGLLIVGIIAAGLIGALIARGLAAPLGRLAQAADTLAAGEDAAPLPRSRLEEVAHLADAFGQMRSRLAERTAQRERTEAFLRQERDFSDMVINSLPGVFYLVDASGRLLRWNRRLEQVAGFTADDAGQRRLAASVVPGDRPAVLAAMEQVLQEGRASLEAMLIVEGGTPAPYYFTGSRLYIDGEAYVVGMGVDIRERKAAEDEVRRLNAQLEQRVAERTAELEAFNYSVAHDLRAPLRGIDGFGQALLDDYGDTLDDTARTYLQRIRAAAGRMGGLIDGLLNLARLSRRELALGEVDLSAMARDVVAELASHHPERRVAVEIEAGLTAQGDARLLEIVLENLLGNAWKFTQGRENACIAFGARIMSGQMVYFVQDNGAGFDMAYAHKLFVAFQRLHRPGEFEGTGIGLATVDRIIRRHGGRVWAEGQEGKGATFFFTLTLDTAAGATPTA